MYKLNTFFLLPIELNQCPYVQTKENYGKIPSNTAIKIMGDTTALVVVSPTAEGPSRSDPRMQPVRQ